MKSIAIKIVNLIALLLSVAWLTKSPDWEPAVTSLGLLAALIAQEIVPFSKATNQRDKDLAKQFLAIFPSNGESADFLNNQDLGAPFRETALNDLNNFLERWNNAEYEFNNKALEKQKKQFYKKAKDFQTAIWESASIHGIRHDFLSIGLRDYETRQDMIELKGRLNDQATELYELHQRLVRKLNSLLKSDTIAINKS